MRSKFYYTKEYRYRLQRAFYKSHEKMRGKRLGILQIRNIIRESLRDVGLSGTDKEVNYVLGFYKRAKLLVNVEGSTFLVK